jgi:hypothetical protein
MRFLLEEQNMDYIRNNACMLTGAVMSAFIIVAAFATTL